MSSSIECRAQIESYTGDLRHKGWAMANMHFAAFYCGRVDCIN